MEIEVGGNLSFTIVAFFVCCLVAFGISECTESDIARIKAKAEYIERAQEENKTPEARP